MSRQQIKQELLESQQKVWSLQELSAQLLVAAKPDAQPPQTQRSEQSRAQGGDCLEAQEKVHVIMNRLKLLLREVTSDLQDLEKRLEAVDKQQVRKQETQSSSCLPPLAAGAKQSFCVLQESFMPKGKSEVCHSAGRMSEVTGQSRKQLVMFSLIIARRGHPLHKTSLVSL